MNTTCKSLSALTLAFVLLAGLSSTRAAAAQKMDLNTCSEASLMQIPGVHKQMADLIIAHRNYATINELSDKTGIKNEQMLARIAEWSIQPYTTPRAASGGNGNSGSGFGGIAGR
ncbi:MAG TPA: helix-hairpin-helix domain-containing protein [Planctomycetota bacterium]|nr:helix-hairpin-helix domain-containing protein [Planctomycetota bacterium]